jgi:hypothetical protein
LRNEAFVRNNKGEGIYPPNSSGWNPLKHQLPITLKHFTNLNQPETVEGEKRWKIYAMGIMFAITVGLFVFKIKPVKPK